MLVVRIIIFAILVVIFYDDWRHRSLRLVFLPVLFGLLGFLRFQDAEPFLLVTNFFLNLAYLAIVGALVILYLRIRRKINVRDLSRYIGAGDLLFLMTIAVWFDMPEFVLFCAISFACALVFHLIVRWRWKMDTIPLAGYQSLCFLVVLLIQSNQYL